MLDRLQQKQQQEGQRTHANWRMSYNIPHRTPHNTRSSYQSVEVLLSLFKKVEELKKNLILMVQKLTLFTRTFFRRNFDEFNVIFRKL